MDVTVKRLYMEKRPDKLSGDNINRSRERKYARVVHKKKQKSETGPLNPSKTKQTNKHKSETGPINKSIKKLTQTQV